LGYSDII